MPTAAIAALSFCDISCSFVWTPFTASIAGREEKHGRTIPLYDDVKPLARTLFEAAADRTIWCTDWPHVQYRKRMPNDAELLEFLFSVIPGAEQRRKVMVDNPSRLHDF
ncbi:MAG: amidohydrolase family protein, partial [Sphingomonadaceae bacterium]